MGLLEGRVAVVTGAAQGIGLAIAQAFVREGATVVVADLNRLGAAAAVEKLGGAEVACAVGCDVRAAADVEAALDAAEDAFGPVDIMVNNAGMTRDATMRRMTEQDFDDVVAVHLRGCWLGTRAAAARMRERGGGSIVNVSSISGKVGMVGQTNYSAAKAGIVGLTKAASKEVAFRNVRVNAIQPGYIRTAMTDAMPEHVKEAKIAEIPMGRPGEVDEVASVVVFLASDLSSYMTGTVLEVSGGRHI
ncbi:3-oxoacyl-ACP reductase FabG [Georgenia sp. EYE_87]|uniref:3-oxoacyl-ACP reductase FabG n=1 Tax=Georgenia sp. EYE_87 TaxID=2853448 RepID=UPI0020041B05|nr:3-oxoacyl-ACP reductase FabG [Georgenia sp. EYE_87]MCK6210242.1 3-oxoacyl-ACP reductase FabG [Georgenia sp. EYE_87]